MQVQLASGLTSPQTITVGGVLYTVTFTSNPSALATAGALAAIVPRAIGLALVAAGQAVYLADDNGPPPAADQYDGGVVTSATDPYTPYVSPAYSAGDQY
jgi:hypothetical protein